MTQEYIDPSNAGVVSIQTTYFWGGLDLSQPLAVAQGMNTYLSAVCDGEPVVLPPPPQEATPQSLFAPRIILNSQNKTYKCNVAERRVDLVYTDKQEEYRALGDLWPEYYNANKGMLKFLEEAKPAVVLRMGIVFRLFRQLDISSNTFFHQKFLNSELFDNSYEAHINVLKKTRLDRFDINHWLRLRSLRNKHDIEDDGAMMLEVDINTTLDEVRPFNLYEMERFIQTAYERLCNQDLKYILLQED